MHNNRGVSPGSDVHPADGEPAATAARDRAHIGTTLSDPNIDYAKMAQAYGMYGEGPIARSEGSRAGDQARARAREEGRAGVDRCRHAAKVSVQLVGAAPRVRPGPTHGSAPTTAVARREEHAISCFRVVVALRVDGPGRLVVRTGTRGAQGSSRRKRANRAKICTCATAATPATATTATAAPARDSCRCA